MARSGTKRCTRRSRSSNAALAGPITLTSGPCALPRKSNSCSAMEVPRPRSLIQGSISAMSQSRSSLCRGVFPDTSTSSPSTSSWFSAASAGSNSKSSIVSAVLVAIAVPYATTDSATLPPSGIAPFAIGRPLDIAIAIAAMASRRTDNAHGSVAIHMAQIGPHGWLPNKSFHTPNSRRTGCSPFAIRNAKYRAAGVTPDSGRPIDQFVRLLFTHWAAKTRARSRCRVAVGWREGFGSEDRI
jgi:hypothetical protein